mmetsp:Transcript_32578/g.80628  ORF Transcript_32578/g.80628 Transcript_32578/m.80628 type:complete len:140 (+) Transcript_32578:519-938(+)
MTWPSGSVFQYGRVKVILPRDSVYEGQRKGGTREGWGKMTCPDGFVFKDPSGCFCDPMTCSGGTVYEGQWKDGMPEGDGKVTCSGSCICDIPGPDFLLRPPRSTSALLITSTYKDDTQKITFPEALFTKPVVVTDTAHM